MKNIFYITLFSIALSSCGKQDKIGFVDNGTLVNDYQEKKDVEAKFQAKDDAFRKRADSIGRAFQAEVQQADVVARKSSQTKAQEMMVSLQQKQQQLQQQLQFEQQELQKSFQAEVDTVISKIKTFVKEYGKKNNYTYILGTSDVAATVMYGSSDKDLTKEVLEALNKAYKK